MKKVESIIFNLLMIFGIFMSTGTAYAASQTVYAHYKVQGSGAGISSGKTNGVWHYLNNNKTVTLKVTQSSGAGKGQCTLKRSILGLDKSYGTVSSSVGTHKFNSKTDATSGSYYLEFYGGNANSTHTIHGILHD